MTDTKEVEVISDAEIIAAIRAATQDVFTTMLGMEITPGETSVEQSVATAPASGVVSLIGLAGSWVGTGCMACSVAFACKMSSQFLMAEYETINEDVLDAVAEITNMIIGNVKTVVEEKVGSMGLSTPTVIFGRNFQTRSARSREWTVVPFTCGEERMFIQMCLAPNKDTERKTMRPGFPIPQVLNL